MSTSTPSSSRRHGHNHRRPDLEEEPPLPPYEPPIAPLNTTGQRNLAALHDATTHRHLKTHIQHAGEKLADSAGEINERLTEARVRAEKEKRRRRAQRGEGSGSGEEEDGEEGEDWGRMEHLGQMEEKVGLVTGLLEERMRKVVDAEVRLDGMGKALTELGREAEAASLRGPQRRTRRRQNEDGEDEEDEDYEDTRQQGDCDIPPSRKLDDKLGEDYERWDDLSLTQRYSSNNAYIGFYRIVHEAKHPGGDIPPLPHSSTWFSHLEDPSTASSTNTSRPRRTNNRPSPAPSDEVAIERERISLKCPLTLLTFQDPVTSTKCPHSFERQAITDMIAQSPTTVPAPLAPVASARRNRRIKAVKCPVCEVLLSADDLRSDPVLLRRVRRAEAAEQREEDDEDGDEVMDDETRQRRRKGVRRSGITVVSDEENNDDEMDVDQDSAQDPVRVKQERALSQMAP